MVFLKINDMLGQLVTMSTTTSMLILTSRRGEQSLSLI